MTVDVVLNPAEIALLPGRDLSATTCVVFDVLRATSSMITALAHGAAEIRPARTIEEALELKASFPDAVLGGERHGERIAGFEVGNSPFEYRDFAGRTIISTTTNGTVALRACDRAQRVLVGAILNLGALVEELRYSSPLEVLLVCAGTFTQFALEDACAAGMLVAALEPTGDLTDSALAALAVTRRFPDPLDAFRLSRNGRALIAKGRASEVDWCALPSRFEVLGDLERGVVRVRRSRSAEPGGALVHSVGLP